MWTNATDTYQADAWPDVNAFRRTVAAQLAAARAANAAEHSHGYLGDEYDGAPYCPVDDCSWNR